MPFLHPIQCTDVFCRFRDQRTSPETPSYRSQACTPSISIKIEPSTRPSPRSDSIPSSTADQTFLKRRSSSPQVSQIKTPGRNDTKLYVDKPPLKKHRSSLSGPLSPKSERKDLPSKSHVQEAGTLNTAMIHQDFESKYPVDPIAPLFSAKAELKIVDELKARRDRLLQAIEQKCEIDCRAEMQPCSIMLRLEIMHGGYAKSWVK